MSSKDDLIQGLNEDLAYEYAAVITYRTYASALMGQARVELRAFFESEIPDELGHAGLLADKIVALGGTPTTEPKPVKSADSAKQMLQYTLQDEIDTIERYVTRRKQAEELGHHGLVVDLDDLIQDESNHRDEIRMVLEHWESD
jgi:bacterioferritin